MTQTATAAGPIATLPQAQPRQQLDLSPQTFEQALTFCNYLAESDLVPKDFKGKPANCLIAIQWGAELGLKPLQALQNLAIINGRPALWGDAVLAIVRASPLCEYVTESDNGHTATCKVKRRGEAEEVRQFSNEDAKLAGLLGKAGPWTQYPKRMRQMRARAFALRDVFTDVLRGMAIAEEVMDIPSSSLGDALRSGDEPSKTGVEGRAPSALQPLSADEFETKFPAWEALIRSGKNTAARVLAKIQTKAMLSEGQVKRIQAVKVDEPTEGDAGTQGEEA